MACTPTLPARRGKDSLVRQRRQKAPSPGTPSDHLPAAPPEIQGQQGFFFCCFQEKSVSRLRPLVIGTDTEPPYLLAAGRCFSNRHVRQYESGIRSSKKQKTTNQWRCGPTSISGSVLLCPVLFCELKPFYRSQWPFSSGSHAPFSDESSSADMFSSRQ